MIIGIDHIQLAMPLGEEHKARQYYGQLLNLTELEKPQVLKVRGGVWFLLPDSRQLHLGIETPFTPAKKAHPAFLVSALAPLAKILLTANFNVQWDDKLAPQKRFYSHDIFGNRLEFIEQA